MTGPRPSLHSRRIALLFAIALALPVGVPHPALGQQPVAADAAAAADIVWPDVPDVGGATLADLSLTDERGTPLRRGVVVASLWPSYDVRTHLQPGDAFTLTPIDRTAIVGGRATVHAADPSLMRAHQSKDGVVMLHIDVFTGRAWSSLRVERRIGPNDKWADPSSTAADAKRRVELAVDAAGSVSLTPDTPHELPVEVDRHHNSPGGCSEFTVVSSTFPATTVATAAVTNGIQAKFRFTSSAESDLSLGMSANAGASWSYNGTVTRTSTLTADFNTVTGVRGAWTNREWRATYENLRYWRHCVGGPPGHAWHEQRYTEPDQVAGFPAIIASRYALPACHTRVSLSGVKSVSTAHSTAMTYGAAFAIPWGPASFSGSARSGYSTEVQMTFERPDASGYWYWCGNTANPVLSAKMRAGR